jgi:alkanesulfonate monooxygenase SsuD/methylene tetrahydromethanopterin reductase-like flavin-dependent oxidoreductase (luciferase family)
MKYGFVLPNGDARTAAEWAHEAEAVGWDGFFVYDSVWGVDAAVMMAAIALRTEHIRIGTLLTPISRHRPWKLAGELAALDNLSDGRIILSVGLGATDTGFANFGEETDRKIRAELMDEGLDILTGLWRGQPFSFSGKHYKVQPTTFMPPPPPVQKPRIPIWVVGAWPHEKSMNRVARYDGLLPAKMNAEGKHVEITPDDLRAMKSYIEQHRTGTTPFDIVAEGRTSNTDRPKQEAAIRPMKEAGATWWIENMWTDPNSPADVQARIRQGPPGI